MIIEIKVPALPESVSEATLMSWHKKVGEAVSREENLIDLETDKVVLELPSPDAGGDGLSPLEGSSFGASEGSSPGKLCSETGTRSPCLSMAPSAFLVGTSEVSRLIHQSSDTVSPSAFFALLLSASQ